MSPQARMLNEAVLAVADELPGQLHKVLAMALLDACGEGDAVAIADRLPSLIRAEQAARVRDAAVRATRDPVGCIPTDAARVSLDVPPKLRESRSILPLLFGLACVVIAGFAALTGQ